MKLEHGRLDYIVEAEIPFVSKHLFPESQYYLLYHICALKAFIFLFQICTTEY